MGFLTDPATEANPVKQFIIKRHFVICLVMYLSSIIWLCMLANDHFSSETYFSENALLPGLVQVEFTDDREAQSILKDLDLLAQTYGQTIPYAYIQSKLKEFHLDTHIHTFSLLSPISKTNDTGRSIFTGKNIYAILRAPRSSNVEALVLSTPYRAPGHAYPYTLPGVALMLSVAKYFRQQKYWAKDIIFLITEYEQLGMLAWLDAYHDITSGTRGYLLNGQLPERSGNIQAALNLEIHSNRISYFDVKVLGLNGQLPNLDLFNLIHKICSKEDASTTFHNKYWNERGTPGWISKLHTMTSMIASQSTGIPDGNHGLFHRYGIEAVSMEGHKIKKYGPRVNLLSVGRILEGVFRSLNNLLERFHQSFFFYLLPSSDRYVSIGFYMPCVVLFAASLYLRSLGLWMKLSWKKENTDDNSQVDEFFNFFSVSVIGFLSHVFGVTFFHLALDLSKLLPFNEADTCVIVTVSLFAFLPLLLFFKFLNLIKTNKASCTLLNVIALNELATFLLCVSVYNFSFGFVIGLIYVLPAIFIQPADNRLITKLIWIAFNPLCVVSLMALIFSTFSFDDLTIMGKCYKMIEITKQVVTEHIVDSVIYGNWTYGIIAAILLPNWIMFWSLITSKPPTIKHKQS